MTKRFFDIALSCALLLGTLPVWIILMIAIPWGSPGGVFYLSPRVGKDGRVFRMIKFRTMRTDAWHLLDHGQREEMKKNFKLANDPRVTPLGAWLRRSSLDELPQLVNVLRGEMSLVGPRPKLPEEIGLYGELTHELLSVQPGMTGYWQVYRTSANSDASMREMDLHYIRKKSLALDLKLLFRTLFVVVRTINY